MEGTKDGMFNFIFQGGLLFGSLSDKVGRRTVILYSTVFLLVASMASAVAPNKWVFLATRMVVGLCIGANYPTAMVFAFEISASKHREMGGSSSFAKLL